MGGVEKGLLPAPDGKTLVERLLQCCNQALPPHTTLLVGKRVAYFELGIEMIADAPGTDGPLGGLVALLELADQRRLRRAIVLSCDLPYLDAQVLRELTRQAPHASALAAKSPSDPDVFEPLIARYETPPALAAARRVAASGRRSLQAVLEELGAEALELPEELSNTLRDWDTPEDQLSSIR